MADPKMWIQEKAKRALRPAVVETSLREIAQNWPETAPPFVEVVERFPLGEAALFHLISISTVCVARLRRDPSILVWLEQPEISLSRRGPAQMANDLQEYSREELPENNFRLLRRWKSREMVRIALREIANVAPLEETTNELSHVAD